MRKTIEAIIGDKFGTRTIIDLLEPTKGSAHIRYKMRCDCGHESVFRNPEMRRQCCVCQRRGSWHPRNGESRTRLYNSWHSMMHRCYRASPNDKNYRHYFGRGIRVCGEWHDWLTFKKWAMSHGYEPSMTLDRINPDKNYGPDNCQWVTREENGRRVYENWRRYHTPIEILWGNC